MSPSGFDALDMLRTPVWLVSPVTEDVLFANTAAKMLMQNATLDVMRKGVCSAHAQATLAMYVPDLKARQEIVEVWSVRVDDQPTSLTCHLSLAVFDTIGEVIVFEGVARQPVTGLKATRSGTYQRKKQGFYARFSRPTAPRCC